MQTFDELAFLQAYMSKTRNNDSACWLRLKALQQKQIEQKAHYKSRPRYLRYLFCCADHLCTLFEVSQNMLNSKVNPSPQIHGVHACCY